MIKGIEGIEHSEQISPEILGLRLDYQALTLGIRIASFRSPRIA